MFGETYNRMFVLNYYYYEFLDTMNIYDNCHFSHLTI